MRAEKIEVGYTVTCTNNYYVSYCSNCLGNLIMFFSRKLYISLQVVLCVCVCEFSMTAVTIGTSLVV